MRYLMWLLASVFLGTAIFLHSAGEGDLTVLGWIFAAVGWGFGAAMSGLAEDTLEAWTQIDRERQKR